MTTPAICTAALGRPFAASDCRACGARAGDDCPRKTNTEKVINQTGGQAKIGLARGNLTK
jgi:hypothetical protein